MIGDYGFYVWTAYWISAAGIVTAVALTVLGRMRARARLEKLK